MALLMMYVKFNCGRLYGEYRRWDTRLSMVLLERVKREFSNASSAIGIRATDHEI